MKTYEALELGAKRLEQVGWAQGSWGFDGVHTREKPGATCMMMSMFGVGCDSDDVVRALCQALGVMGIDALFEWNDAPGRTKNEVLTLMRSTAAVERMKECRHEREAVAA
jgi:hypothetical protein